MHTGNYLRYYSACTKSSSLHCNAKKWTRKQQDIMTKTRFGKKNIVCLQFKFYSCFLYQRTVNFVSGLIYSTNLYPFSSLLWPHWPRLYFKCSKLYLTHCKVEWFPQILMSAQLLRHKCRHELLLEFQGLPSNSELTCGSVTHFDDIDPCQIWLR